MNTRLSIVVMACTTVHNYQDQLTSILETWHGDSVKYGVRCCFYTGEEENEFSTGLQKKADLIHLLGVGDDYESASLKQWLGLDHARKNYPSDFYLVVGTDNYVNIANILSLLEKYDPKFPFLISGKQQSRSVQDIRYQIFPLGGSGLIFSGCALERLDLPNIHKMWKEFSPAEYHAACDLSAAYYAELNRIVMCRDYDMYTHDHIGGSQWGNCHEGAVNYSTVAVFHWMNPKRMKLYHRYKNVMNYYIQLVNMFRPGYEESYIEGYTKNIKSLYQYSYEEAVSVCLGLIESGREGLSLNVGQYKQLSTMMNVLLNPSVKVI